MTQTMRRFQSALLALIVVASASGCYSMRADLPGALRNDLRDEDVEVVGELDVQYRHTFFGAGVLSSPAPNVLSRELMRQARASDADGVSGLTYEAQHDLLDLVISTAGCGGLIVGSRTYRLRGDLVRIRRAPLPGTPLDPRGAPSASAVAY